MTGVMIFLLGEAEKWVDRVTEATASHYRVHALSSKNSDLSKMTYLPYSSVVITPIESYAERLEEINSIRQNPNLHLVLSTPITPTPGLARAIYAQKLADDYISRSTPQIFLLSELIDIIASMNHKREKSLSGKQNITNFLGMKEKSELLKELIFEHV